MKPPVVVDAHASGLHSAPPSAWQRLTRLLAGVEVRASVVAFTECRLRVVPPGWGQYVPAQAGGPNLAECSIGWDLDVWECVAEGWDPVSGVAFRRAGGDVREGVVATWVVLRHRRHTWFLYPRVVAHLPSSVQAGQRWSGKDARVASWRAAVIGLRRLTRQLRREYGARAATVSCDFNLDLDELVWRDRVKVAIRLRRFELAIPGRGTHGNRVIDAFLTTLTRRGVRALEHVRPFDHRPIVARLAVRPHQMPRATDPRLQEIP